MSTTISGDTGVDKVQDEAVTPTAYVSRIKTLTAQNSTSGTAKDFTGIPSWAKKITVMFSGVSTNGTSVPIIQLGTSGGVENYGYSSSGSIIATGVTVTNYTIGFGTAAGINDVATTVRSGQAVITLISGNSYSFSSMLNSTAPEMRIGAGSKTLSATLDRIRITTVNGTDTFDAGQINVMVEG